MTGEQEPTRGQVINAVGRVLREFAPGADSQDVHDFLEELWKCDWDELEVNIGAGFGQFVEGEEACNAAFARYAELIGAVQVVSNPSTPQADA
jgi:hypothetical protein